MNRFRRKRYERFWNLFDISDETHILDVGGLPYDWIKLGFEGRVTCVSLSDVREGYWGNAGNILYLRQNATALPYADNTFRVVFSNSLLEHVGRENQAKVAEEIRRVGRNYWVQAPYRYAPFEPHYKAPFFWHFPKPMRRLIATYWTSLVREKNYYLRELDTIWLPTQREMKALFPTANVMNERILGMTKSLIAWEKEGMAT